jgi:STE24 endopeptidase
MDDRARIYHRWQLILSAINLILTAGVLALAAWLLSVERPPATAGGLDLLLLVGLELVLLGFAVTVVTAPLGFVSGYWLARRFGLLHQPLGRWLLDRLKAAAIGGALGLIAFEIIYGLLAHTALWWLLAAAIFFAGGVLLATVTPIWFLPLFYRLTTLADAALRDRLLALAARVGVPVIGVWVADQSTKSKTANAGLTGIGRTRRIVLFDTLLSQFTPDEVESVLAHELGHHVHGDIRRGLLVQGVLTLATFWIADRLLRVSAQAFGWMGLADPVGVPWLALVLLGLGIIAAPLGNTFSRWVERRADDFALATTGNVPAFVGAMERLATLNLAERRPNRLKELLLYSHPSIDRRIARALSLGGGLRPPSEPPPFSLGGGFRPPSEPFPVDCAGEAGARGTPRPP